MKRGLASFVVGTLFALGLGLSGMTQVTKVTGFLDIFGAWDPSLMFVMVGAIGVHGLGYYFVRKRHSPVLDKEFHVPKRKDINLPLISGAFIFGIGWAMSGFCPGPAVVSLVTFDARPWIFFLSMLIGMRVFRYVSRTKIYSPP